MGCAGCVRVGGVSGMLAWHIPLLSIHSTRNVYRSLPSMGDPRTRPNHLRKSAVQRGQRVSHAGSRLYHSRLEDSALHSMVCSSNPPWSHDWLLMLVCQGLAHISHRRRLGLGTFTLYEYRPAGSENVDVLVVDGGININHIEFEGYASWCSTRFFAFQLIFLPLTPTPHHECHQEMNHCYQYDALNSGLLLHRSRAS